MKIMRIRVTPGVGAAILLAASAHGAVINAPETFGDGGPAVTNGWTPGAGGAVAGAGENGIGDHALLYVVAASPSGNTGFHVLQPHGAQTPNPDFLGDYTAAGAVAIRFNARHTGIGSDLVLRATLFDDFGDGVDAAFTSAVVSIPATATSWQTYTLSITAGDLIAQGDNSHTAAQILAAVAQVGLRHDPAGTGPLTQSPVDLGTQAFFDDIVLIPAPGIAALAPVGLLVLARRRRR